MEIQLEKSDERKKINSREYFFLISPDMHIKSRVKQLKNQLHSEIVITKENIVSTAHLSFFKILIKGERQNEAFAGNIRHLETLLRSFKSFRIEISGNMVFNHGKCFSLVLTLCNPEPVIELHNFLADSIGIRTRSILPHITIARNVAFEKLNCISSLASYEIEDGFICRSVTILFKDAFDNRYSTFCEMPFYG